MYAWTIVEDLVADPKAKEGTNNNAKTICGPRGVTLSSEEICSHPKRQYFEMYDDDNELYYKGYFVPDADTTGFEPLDDFGQPNAGCTSISYRDASGQMKPL